jgi:hypothetical protein
MENKKKKNAFGWFQVFKGDPKKSEEVFNHMMNDHPNAESQSGEATASDGAMAEAFDEMMENPENNLEAMRALRELKD